MKAKLVEIRNYRVFRLSVFNSKLKSGMLCLLLLLFSPTLLAQSLSLGPFGEGVITGSAPFNVTGTCTQAGDDCAGNDNRIRSADIQNHFWSLSMSGIPAGDPAVESVVFEQTLIPGLNASLQFDEIPTICLAPPQGPGGSNPLSSITENADGSITLLCNLGSMGNGDQKSFSVPIRPLADSANGSTFTSAQKAYGLDVNGVQIIADTTYTDPATYSVSAAPAWDLIGDRRALYQGGATSFDVGTGRGVEDGFYLWVTAHLSADVDRAGKGVSSLTNSFSFNNALTAVASDGVTNFPLEYGITQCIPNPSGWSNTVWGNESIQPSKPFGEHVVDSGSCAISGDALNGWTLTANNVDTSGTRFPSQTIGNSSLAAGPYFSMAYRLRIFVPFSEIDRENPTPLSGSISVTNCMNDFNPDDLYSNSNYGLGVEPGHNGTAMPDGSASNNCSGPLTLEIVSKGSFTFRALSSTNDGGQVVYAPLLSGGSTGDGIVESTVKWPYLNSLTNSGSVPLSNTQICSAFDNTTQKLSDRASVGGSAGANAWFATYAGAVKSDWQVEYASMNFPNVDPLDNDGDGVSDFNPMSGRYEGDWTEMQAFRCDDPAVNWSTDPNTVGIDNVNAVRIVKASPTVQLNPAESMRLVLPVEARSIFYGGPYAGTSIPAGTVLAAYGNWRSDESRPSGFNNLYQPSPETTNWHGDRMTFTKVGVDVAKSTVSPAAPAGTVASTLAGNTVIWQLDPTFSSVLTNGSNAINAEVVDILPAELTYDGACTQAEPGGVPPTQILYNTPAVGQTTLKWSLGNPHTSAPVTPLIYCTTTDATAPAGTAVVNRATNNADNAVLSNPALQTVTLGQAGSIQAAASVDVPVDLANDSQVHTLTWSNFSNAAPVSPTVVVNVFPYNGDTAGLADRSPGSDFNGSLTLTGPATDSWSDGSTPGAGDPFTQIGTIFYSAETPASINHDPDLNTSDWCSWDGSAFVPEVAGMNCPSAFVDVTAIKHVSNYDLEINGDPRQGINLSYTLQATGNVSADRYVNLFGVDSVDLPAAQYVKGNRSIVIISGHSIGDLVFVDIDGDGAYDASIDIPAPDGLAVELYDFSSDALVEATTTTNGTYLFDDLAPGDYYVRIPSSVFGAAGPLIGWTAATGSANANTDLNHDIDHNGMVSGSADVSGVFTDMITVDANPPLPGASPVGNEPVGDNSLPIADYNTNDDFSNLTIDLGLISADSDQDGIPDAYEFGASGLTALEDTDNDGTPDYLDSDSDGDGIPDALEFGSNPAIFSDSDGDGIADHLDLDSDNDGIPDDVESGQSGQDSDGDGIDDTFDVDETGGSDLDGNGIDDAVEAAGMLDTDMDGIPDVNDLDSDNDGITDTIEAGGSDSDGDGIVDGFTDADGDGIDDTTHTTPLAVDDTDGDGDADYLDTDADNDGINDTIEAGGVDADGDGVIDGFTDADGDGLDDATATTPLAVTNTDSGGAPNHTDFDSDGDGIPDAIEGNVDSDLDGVPDYLDLDSDNDGIPDAIEAPVSGVDTDGDGIDDIYDVNATGGVDANGDGLDDSVVANGVNDIDGDGTPDYLDIDSDNDGINDAIEAGGVDANGDGVIDGFTDANGDGLDDATATTPLAVTNTDSGGAPNHADFDSDGDGIPDAIEGNVDTDLDGVPDYLDLDSDNDGIPDATEAPGAGIDSDGDGIDDVYDVNATGGVDANGDGLDDAVVASGVNDIDGDGTPDYLDIDSDNDGINDAIEAGGVDANNDGVIDGFTDADGDGLDDTTATTPLAVTNTDSGGAPNHADFDSDGDGIPDAIEGNVDSDLDGVPDYLDLDSDNDGIPDATEAPASGVDTDGDGIDDIYDVNATGGVDANGDGLDDAVVAIGVRDTDSDGLPDYLDVDSDGDSIPDAIEDNVDSDLDGLPDYLDLDSDNDGIPDTIEAPVSGVDTDSDGIDDIYDVNATGGVDANGDGLDDAVVANGVNDIDGDGTPDYLDIDSDNDGINDAIEAGGVDANNDGVIDGFTDANGDGLDDATATTPLAVTNTDSGGAPNHTDFDSDNDGIPDAIEGNVDTDNDGVPDYLDLDSDNDGMPDAMEAPVSGIDTDGDGIDDIYDVNATGGVDANGDGLDDAVVANGVHDTDGDGLPDYLDIDSDNDGINDAIEAGGVDANGDGMIDGFTDANGNGLDDATATTPLAVTNTDTHGAPNYADFDSDGDGIPDAIEGNVDTDNDGVPNYLDLDSDNDGMPDAMEAPVSGIDTDGDGIDDIYDVNATGGVDANGDGLDDAVVANGVRDTDGDSLPDYLDIDSDNDGINDAIEAGGVDANDDGMIDGFTDANGDGLDDATATTPLAVTNTDSGGAPNHADFDSDNDGIPDAIEGNVDTDNDGVPDYLDLDADNDGIPDAIEAGTGTDSDGDGIDDLFDVDQTAGVDANGDGVDDGLTALDSDADGVPDYLDLDSDNDGLTDALEAGGTDSDGDGVIDGFNDTNDDGIDDATSTTPLPVGDTDVDGTPDYLDIDSDNDGINDAVEAGGVDADVDGVIDGFTDANGDGLDDSTATTPLAITSTDSDGTPNHVDIDSDDDGIPDAIEGNVDTDNDGVPDYLDLDSDNDGVPDATEAPGSGIDTDGDGIDDLYDVDATGGVDANGDGLDDAVVAAGVLDSDADGVPDFLQIESDADGDGLPDLMEGTVDTDTDGTPDYLDLDSDNDGIPDSVEAIFEGSIPADKDGDNVPDYIDVDSDNDGISDSFEGGGDIDEDGVKNFRDLDVDNDGILDIIEARIGMTGVNALDDNLDGVIDLSYDYGSNGMADVVETAPDSGIENYQLPDIDEDGLVDWQDLDSDNDGLLDTIESDHADANLDGVIDAFQNGQLILDDEGLPTNALSVDDTGLANGAGGAPRNTDADGLADFRDVDSDNDGLTDLLESFGPNADTDGDGRIDNFVDTDGDGFDDLWMGTSTSATDSDGDGIIDALEIDSDGDGLSDLYEAGSVDADGNGMVDQFIDVNQDGLDDALGSFPLDPPDTDGDGLLDYQDIDSDGDGRSDLDEGGAIDADGDGVADSLVIGAALGANDTPDYLEVTGVIRTGLEASGCSIGSNTRTLDPLMMLQLLLAFGFLGYRRRKNLLQS